jgi:hypothetical protein|tara:strand:- start:57898 stop:58401 length:504 start_codon:yes stop_codon:yes gene_type:complete
MEIKVNGEQRRVLHDLRMACNMMGAREVTAQLLLAMAWRHPSPLSRLRALEKKGLAKTTDDAHGFAWTITKAGRDFCQSDRGDGLYLFQSLLSQEETLSCSIQEKGGKLFEFEANITEIEACLPINLGEEHSVQERHSVGHLNISIQTTGDIGATFPRPQLGLKNDI